LKKNTPQTLASLRWAHLDPHQGSACSVEDVAARTQPDHPDLARV